MNTLYLKATGEFEIEVLEEMSFYAFYNTRVRQVGIIVYG